MKGRPDGWRTMESAPRDGSGILVCNADLRSGCHNVVHWDETINRCASAGGHCWWTMESDGNSFGFHTEAFTHWMPLPPPPEAAHP